MRVGVVMGTEMNLWSCWNNWRVGGDVPLFFRVEAAFREGDLKMGSGGEPLRQVSGGRAVQGMDVKLVSGGQGLHPALLPHPSASLSCWLEHQSCHLHVGIP